MALPLLATGMGSHPFGGALFIAHFDVFLHFPRSAESVRGAADDDRRPPPTKQPPSGTSAKTTSAKVSAITTISHPANNHAPTTTQPSFVSNPRAIPTQPSHIRDSPNPTQPQPQQNGRCGTFAAHPPRRCRAAASRSSPCPRRPAPYPRRKDRDSSYVIPIAADLHRSTLLRKAPRVVRLARLPHIGHAPACASFGSPSARFPPKGFRLSAVHLCTACSALRAIPSLRSAPLIDIAFGDSSLRSSGDISLRSADMS